jgi:hypothetical protein
MESKQPSTPASNYLSSAIAAYHDPLFPPFIKQ